jgi:hypothetical protein
MRLRLDQLAADATVGWVRVEPGPCDCHHPPMRHDRWEIRIGDGPLDYRLITDFAISTYGRRHIETRVLVNLPPLPEQAWKADTHLERSTTDDGK